MAGGGLFLNRKLSCRRFFKSERTSANLDERTVEPFAVLRRALCAKFNHLVKVFFRALVVEDADSRHVDLSLASAAEAFPAEDEEVGRRALLGQRLELVDQVVQTSGGFNSFNIWKEVASFVSI